MLPTLVALALALAPQEPAPASLEVYLARARAERAALAERLAPRVEEWLRALESDPSPGPMALADLRREMQELGSEGGFVLLPHIDPGPEATQAAAFRAREMTRVLVHLQPAGVVDDLASACERGTRRGRLHALEVLGHVPERRRAGIHLVELFGRLEGELRLECARSLGALGGNADTLRGALTDEDPAIRRTVLASLARAAQADAAPAVAELLRDPSLAAPVTAEIAAYWSAVPKEVDEAVVDALIGLSLRTDVPTGDRTLVLEALPAFAAARDRRVVRRLEPVTRAPEIQIREAALVCTVLLGDRGARRELLRPYDDTIDTSEDWWKGYSQRGDVLLRIGDYAAAARDFDAALELLGERKRSNTHHDLWIQLARAHTLGGKLNRAADALDQVVLSPAEKADLRADPDFAELVAHSRYGKVLE